jgi:acetylornithine/succinyldiaminopimelate/putrescine aminotransferase
MDSFFFWNSGSEAVEAAIKMARAITGKQNIIGMQGQSDLGHIGILSLLIISTQAATMAELTELWRSLKVK